MRKFTSWLAAALIALSIHARAEDETIWRTAVSIPDFFWSGDSEGFGTREYRVGFYPRYEHGERYVGLEYQRSDYSQDGWNASGDQISVLTRAINPRTGLGYNLSLGYDDSAGHRLLVTDSYWGFRLDDRTTAELILNRDRVETRQAIDRGVHFTLAAASIEHRFTERLSAMGLAGIQAFSDDNTRPMLRARLVYDLFPDQGITAQLRYRIFHSSEEDVGGDYFNPSDYQEVMLALGIRRRLAGWLVRGTAGLGMQTIDQDDSSNTHLLEFAATSPLAGRVFFRTRAGYAKSAGVQGPDYTHRYLMEELFIGF